MSTQTLTRETQLVGSVTAPSSLPFSSTRTPTEFTQASIRQRFVSDRKSAAPLVICCISAITFSIMLWGIINYSSQITNTFTYICCCAALSIPVLVGVRHLFKYVSMMRKRIIFEDSNEAMICAVEVCINNETVLTVRSWWPLRMTNADVEKHGVRVAMSSAQRWLGENSLPGGKISRVRFDPEIASGLCSEYLCHASGAACGDEHHCSVCLDDLEAGSSVSMKKCGHSFHVDCLSLWFSQSSRLVCPMCRSDHYALVPPTVISKHTVKEEPSVSVLSVSIDQGTLAQ